MLIVREDNLPAAITAFKAGEWDVLQGKKSFEYIHKKSGFDLLAAFIVFAKSKEFFIAR